MLATHYHQFSNQRQRQDNYIITIFKLFIFALSAATGVKKERILSLDFHDRQLTALFYILFYVVNEFTYILLLNFTCLN